MIRFPKPDCPSLIDLAYVSPNFNYSDLPIMHHVLHVLTHKIVALIGCINIGGAPLDFLEKCAK
jgi:hypothetical protein